MTISDRLVEMTAAVRARADAYAATARAMVARAADSARDGVASAASKIDAVKTPVETLEAAGHQLNALAHSTAERMLGQTVSVIQGLVSESAVRLRLLAKAANLRSAANQQVAYFDVTRERIARDLRGSYAVVTDASRNAKELAVRTYATLSSTARKAKKAAKPVRRNVVRAKKSLKVKARKAA